MVIWSLPARQDLKEIHDFIARDSKHYAKKVAGEIVKKSEILNTFPEIGRILPELNSPDIREILIYSYRLIYHRAGTHVEVLALVHERRNYSPESLELDKE